MHINFIIILSTLIVSLISLIGLVTLTLKKRFLKKVLFILVAFSAGSLLGASFFDILPEVIEEFGISSLSYVLIGILIFFGVERYISWHHCHEGDCDVKPFAYLNLIGDGIHNLIDGALIAASYLHDFHLGLITTIAVIFHEIPQELGDFGVLIHGGIKPKKALLFNFVSALVAILGSLLTIFFVGSFGNIIPILLSVAAGGFIYLALVDIVPEIHKEVNNKTVVIQSVALFMGLVVMFLLSRFLGH
ncbi:MAG: ZIP family metal transporter [Candidatus Aenigmarchaeota archaeon]|nr:ZIP family metal transporter [Candidatus Aenigmarchaeota archaeon]